MLTKSDIDWLKGEYLRSLADTVKKDLSDKIDIMNSKLDTFIGEIKARREEQSLHENQHEELDSRVSRTEKTLNLQPLSN
ncbi:MAG: hypothetical protein AAB508_06475 [Patescibacteria group bacterium]